MLYVVCYCIPDYDNYHINRTILPSFVLRTWHCKDIFAFLHSIFIYQAPAELKMYNFQQHSLKHIVPVPVIDKGSVLMPFGAMSQFGRLSENEKECIE